MRSQAYQWGETARSAQQRDDRAHARTISPAKRSTAATFRNIQPPTTFGGILASRTTFRNNRRTYHWKRHNCQRRYVLKYLHLGLNSEARLTLRSRAQLALRSEPHPRPGSRRYKHIGTVSIGDRGRITLVRVDSHAQQLASPKLSRIAPVSKRNQCAASSLHLSLIHI